jgi:lysophospholipase L1-like esterase
MQSFCIAASVVLMIGLMLCAVGCSESAAPVDTAADAQRVTNYLAIGDSYTIGEGVEPADQWPMQLATQLRAAGAKVDDPHIVARTGWTCAELSAAMDEEPAGRKYAMVSLLIGVNDQYRGGAAEPYRAAFAKLLVRAIALAGGEPKHVLVLSIPDWGQTPFGQNDSRGAERIGKEIDAFNAINREESERAGVKYVDITPVSREVARDKSLAADDGLHPTAAMYAKWTAIALTAAKEIVAPK